MGLSPMEWRRISKFLEKNSPDVASIGDRQMEERIRHFKQILDAVEKQKFYTLAEPVKQSPLQTLADQVQTQAQGQSIAIGAGSVLDEPKGGRNRWKKTPWIFRSSAEAFAITLGILGLVVALPKVLTIYEERMQQQLDAFDLADIMRSGSARLKSNEELDTELSKMLQTDTLLGSFLNKDLEEGDPTLTHEIEKVVPATEIDVSALKSEAGGVEVVDPDTLKVGHYERWRFEIKTDAPNELRPNVIEVLREAGLGESTEGFRGRAVPGGVQFEIIVDREQVIPIMKGIMELAAHISGGDIGASFRTFTWYRTKARGRRLSKEETQIQIWLAQI